MVSDFSSNWTEQCVDHSHSASLFLALLCSFLCFALFSLFFIWSLPSCFFSLPLHFSPFLYFFTLFSLSSPFPLPARVCIDKSLLSLLLDHKSQQKPNTRDLARQMSFHLVPRQYFCCSWNVKIALKSPMLIRIYCHVFHFILFCCV